MDPGQIENGSNPANGMIVRYLLVVEPPHHRPPPRRIASERRNHCSRKPSTTFACQFRTQSSACPGWSRHLALPDLRQPVLLREIGLRRRGAEQGTRIGLVVGDCGHGEVSVPQPLRIMFDAQINAASCKERSASAVSPPRSRATSSPRMRHSSETNMPHLRVAHFAEQPRDERQRVTVAAVSAITTAGSKANKPMPCRGSNAGSICPSPPVRSPCIACVRPAGTIQSPRRPVDRIWSRGAAFRWPTPGRRRT
jgi:hypothetical protein